MANLKTCSICSTRFGPSHRANHTICRYCNLRSDFQDKLADATNQITDATEQIIFLTRRVNTLEEFVSANIATDSSRPAASQDLIAAPESTTITGSPTLTNEVSPTQNNDFQRVTNGIKATKTRHVIPITTYNKFQILTENNDDENEPEETRLVGDSIIRGQLTEFCGRAPNRRKRFCIPGASLDDVDAAIDEVTNGATSNTLFLIHAGTNDITRTRSEELLEKYKKVIRNYKTKSNNVLISGVLPRIDTEPVFYSKAFSLNNRLESLCLQEGVEFVNHWNQFFEQPTLFAKDGLHLNSIGSARFGRLLSESIRVFKSKNAERPSPSDRET